MFILAGMYIENKQNSKEINDINTRISKVKGTFRFMFQPSDKEHIYITGDFLASMSCAIKDIKFIIQNTLSGETRILNFYDFIEVVNDDVYLCCYRKNAFLSVTVLSLFAYKLGQLLTYKGCEQLNYVISNLCTVNIVHLNLKVDWDTWIWKNKGYLFSDYFPEFLIQLKKTGEKFGVEYKDNAIYFLTVNEHMVMYKYIFEIADLNDFNKLMAKALVSGVATCLF